VIVNEPSRRATDKTRFVVASTHGGVFERRVPDVTAKTRLPEGRALAGFFDAEGNAVALSEPFAIYPSETSKVTITPPARNAAAVLLIVNKRGPDPIRVTLMQQQKELTPDFVADAEHRLIAVWHRLPISDARVVVTHGAADDIHVLALTSGRVTTLRATVQPVQQNGDPK
jgi:hypothetical protein